MINLHKLKSKNSTKSITLTLCFNLIIFTINPRKLKNSRNNRIVNNKLKAMDLKKKKSYKKHERTTIFHETKKKKKKDKNNYRHTPIYILFTTRNQFLRSHEQQSTTI